MNSKTSNGLLATCVGEREREREREKLLTSLSDTTYSLVPRPFERRRKGMVYTEYACFIFPSKHWKFVFLSFFSE